MAQSRKKSFVLWFKELGIKDVPLVGGKNAALGEMYSKLSKLGVHPVRNSPPRRPLRGARRAGEISNGINIPDGFALTAYAYRFFLKKTGLDKKIQAILKNTDTKSIKSLQKAGKEIREAIVAAELPKELVRAIREAYRKLERVYGKNTDVAVRSSATAEDLPGASFAGQQETYLNIVGVDSVLAATKKCIASLFTDRAISYRVDKGFAHTDVALSVGVQKMVRSDIASSGVIFTIDTESGFDNAIVITASWGLGEMVVQGKVTPDEFMVFKPTLETGHRSIIEQNLGEKNIKLIYAKEGTKKVNVSESNQAKFCISENEVLTLAKWSLEIEKYFSKVHKRYQPMDIEWAKDGKTKKLFIVQARPETVQALTDKKIYREYHLQKQGKVLVDGIAVGAKIGAGPVRVIKDVKKIKDFKKGEVLVTEITDPDWEPIMKIASAIVTDKGGRTSHAAIVSRELGIPCIVGAEKATKVLRTGQKVTVDCASGEVGHVYAGILPFAIKEHRLDKMPKPKVKVMVNVGSPDEAFKNHFLPAQGVGLGRLEFIIASHIKIHPNALIDYPKLVSEARRNPATKKLVEKIDAITRGYRKKTDFYVDELAEGIAKIGAAFWPNEVIIRFSDFKTNEYRKLLGGERYEPEEENPMLGWRGASRYYDPKFKDAFGLEVKALKKVRETMGLRNVVPMIPFCRTPEEGRRVVEIMAKHGLDRKKDKKLKIYVMCEIPSNILLADEFLAIFDGMSIGSNDLTQLTLGLDRDSGIVTHIANEKDESVKKLIAEIIHKCNAKKKY
ncbi:phosphoenolpyruvate synthase, partial [bacterium]